MSKNSITVSNETLCLLKCPYCEMGFTNYIKHIACERNHTFDFSNSGYLNLLKKNKNVIYDKSLFDARKQIAKNGFFDGVEQHIIKIIIEKYQLKEQLTVLDLGCGDGTFFSNILLALKQTGIQYNAVGIDNSKEGITLASRSDKSVLWLVSDIANVPIIENSIDVILNTLSPANYSEFNRLLKDDGIIIKTVPNQGYLTELRQAIHLNDYSNNNVVSLFSENTLNYKSVRVNYQKNLSDEERKLVFEMTPLTKRIEFNAQGSNFPNIATVDATVLIGEKKTHPPTLYNEALHKLEKTINELEIEADYSIQRIETVINLILECLSELKEYILEKGFKNKEEEIHFFRHQKPMIVAKLVYYNAIYKIETKKPQGAKTLKKYLNRELKKLKRYFDNNLDFYKYYRTNNTSLDEKLFVRGNHDIKLCLDTGYFQSDFSFSTSHDYKVAKIIANDLIQVYIEDQLYNKDQKDNPKAPKKLNWTGSKVAIIELIYSLHYQGVFDNGNADIRLIAKYFEDAFNVNLGNFYQTYLELRSRKMNQTKFLDTLRETLLRKMEEQDGI